MTTLTLPKSAYQTEKHGSRSERYKFISTMDVIQEAVKSGWVVRTSGQSNIRKKEFDGFQKHIVIMENPLYKNGNRSIQLCVRNSHNGQSGLQLFVGCMVMACSNQLFAKDLMGNGNAISIRHSENGFRAMQNFIANFGDLVNRFASNITRFEEKVLTPEQVRVFAEKSLSLRYEATEFNEGTISEAIKCLHSEQKQDNLWNVLNRVQEALVRGNVHVVSKKSGKVRRVRKIKSMDVLVDLNTKILNLANEFVNV